MSSISRIVGAAVLACALLAGTAQAVERCNPTPGNDYEKIYCDLVRSGHGDGLPPIYQFRQNPPTVQALILSDVAEKAGVKIQLPERSNEETVRRQDDLLLSTDKAKAGPVPLDRAVKTIAIFRLAPPPETTPAKPAVVTAPPPAAALAPASAKPAASAAVPAAVPTPSATSNANAAASDALTDCTLEKLSFQCADGRYQLVSNKTNQQLPDDALADSHKLGLPTYKGSPDDAAALDRYLAKAYDQYLTGMVSIGLGASTMSYTKFVNLYHYISGQHLDFATRFETMYDYLKQDKSSMGVSTQVTIADGLKTTSCSRLDHFIACDHAQTNYVFAKQDAAMQ